MAHDNKASPLELLVLRCKRGEKQAFNELIRQWERELLSYVLGRTPSQEDARDVVQETWKKVWLGIKSLDDPRSFPAWLFTIAQRTAAKHWRSHYREQEVLKDVARADFADAEEIRHFEVAEQVHSALNRTPEVHREGLLLRYAADLSLEEIAEILDEPLGTIKSRLFYAKRAMRGFLESEDGNS